MSNYFNRFSKRKEEIEFLYQELYSDSSSLAELEKEMEVFSIVRSDELKELDSKREDTLWYLNNNVLALTMYTDLFARDINGLIKKVPYLKEMGITYLHLMPLLSMPEKENDGGYAVSDFNTVDEKFGNNDDLASLTKSLRAEGISLCLDFVMNHTSSEHSWAKEAKMGKVEYQERYLCYSDRTLPDSFESTVPQVFPSSAPGNFTWCEEMRKWVFTSFYPFQWDLNYKNPKVLNEMLYSMLRLANLGVEVFRLDAVPYIWKELGTNCRNLPQVHTIVRLIRLVLECVCPTVILKGEVVMAPKELAAYFGTVEKPECHLLYNVSTMVNLWSALASQKVTLLKSQIDAILALPKHCEFLNYVRCHDDIGWGLDEDKERELGINPLEHKKFLYNFFSGKFDKSYARGELYNYDAVTQDARSCGTCASLCGLESATNNEEFEKAIKRFLLMYATMYALKGFPMINSGDEIAQLNDYSYTNKEDSRNVHRSFYAWQKAERRNTKGTLEYRIFNSLTQIESVRANSPLFDYDAIVSTWDSQNEKVLALRRTKEKDDMLIVSNFSDKKEFCKFEYFVGDYRDLFTQKVVVPGWGFEIESHEVMYLEKLGNENINKV